MLINIEIGVFSFKLIFDVKLQKKIRFQKVKPVKPKAKTLDHMSLVLNKNLKHLNFIDGLEMNYSEKQLKSIPYLQELKDIKLEAQRNTLALFNRKVAS